MLLLERDRVVADDWSVVGADAPLPQGMPVILDLARFRAEAAGLEGRNAPTGVMLQPADVSADLSDVAARAALVAVHFGIFRDGRGFTIARRLRERHGYGGVLRAMGHILPDQHLFLRRCGFDQVAVPRDDDLPDWVEALGAFSMAYQPSPLAEESAGGLRRLRPGVAL